MKQTLIEKLLLYLMALISAASLASYSAVMVLCRREAREHDPARAARRTQLANLAHTLDWAMNILIGLVGIGRLYRDENFGGQRQPRWLKLYFMISGPLPTIGMVGAMISGHRWGAQLGQDARKRNIHRAFAWLGYSSWWLSVIPMFAQPYLNRQAAAQDAAVLEQS
jgi:hypothetical protein